MRDAPDPAFALRPREVPYEPGLFAGLQVREVSLDEYEEPYRVLEAQPGAPLLALIEGSPLVRVAVPADLRAREPAFRAFDTQITRCVHSQPPHQDHPHRPGDHRRTNLFWAEEARTNASTYFLPLGLAGPVAGWWSSAVRASPEAWEQSQPKLELYTEDPLLMSRYLVPDEAVRAYVALARDGDEGPWAGLTDFGQIMTVARILGNKPWITSRLPDFFAWMDHRWPGALTVEGWREPCVVLADDTRCLHGRYGVGDSGGGFFRMWLAVSGDQAEREAPLYLRASTVAP